MEKFKSYTIIGLTVIIAILLLLGQCNSPKPKEVNLEPKIVEKWDTIKVTYKVVEFKTKYKPVPTIIEDILPGEINQDSLFYVRTYNDSLWDSDITVYTKTRVIGILDKEEVSYRLKGPKYIEHTVTKTEYLTKIESPKFSIYTGIVVGGNKSSFNTSPFLDINYKKATVGMSYGLLDKSIGIKVGYKIFSSNR